MASPERLNVLISRARNGLILVGNSSTFEESKMGGKLWSRFFDLLRKGGHFYGGFAIKCERHPNWSRLMKRPDDFDTSPGCTERWYVSSPLFAPSVYVLTLYTQWDVTQLWRSSVHSQMPCGSQSTR